MREKIREFITTRFMFDDRSQKLDDSTSFLSTGIIDSTGVIELVAFLEQEFSIAVEDDELVPENLDSITSLCRYLEKKGVVVAGA